MLRLIWICNYQALWENQVEPLPFISTLCSKAWCFVCSPQPFLRHFPVCILDTHHGFRVYRGWEGCSEGCGDGNRVGRRSWDSAAGWACGKANFKAYSMYPKLPKLFSKAMDSHGQEKKKQGIMCLGLSHSSFLNAGFKHGSWKYNTPKASKNHGLPTKISQCVGWFRGLKVAHLATRMKASGAWQLWGLSCAFSTLWPHIHFQRIWALIGVRSFVAFVCALVSLQAWKTTQKISLYHNFLATFLQGVWFSNSSFAEETGPERSGEPSLPSHATDGFLRLWLPLSAAMAGEYLPHPAAFAAYGHLLPVYSECPFGHYRQWINMWAWLQDTTNNWYGTMYFMRHKGYIMIYHQHWTIQQTWYLGVSENFVYPQIANSMNKVMTHLCI